MRDALLDLLVDPIDASALRLVNARRDDAGEVIEGQLEGGCGRNYDVSGAIPRLVTTTDDDQRQTERSFGFKWQQQHTYSSSEMRDRSRAWLIQRYGFSSAPEMSHFMSARGSVLDAGCGGGFSASLWLTPAWDGRMWVGADISNAVDVARQRLGAVPNTHFVQADVLQVPFKSETFDVVFSEGVLHHTPSTERAFHSLVPLLRPGGELMAYVYRRKGPLREFCDDHVRHKIASLPPEEAWSQLRPLTALGRALAGLHTEVDIPEDIPLLGITAGRYDVQRLVYWHFAKVFWNDAYSFEENNHINFDWYHPRYAHRHTEEEVTGWCADAGLRISHLDVQESGITVRAVRS